MSGYIVLSSNSYHQVQAFGTATGKLFESEEAAERARRKFEKGHPGLDWLVLPISEADVLYREPAS